jgi:hypothetical protein
VGGKTKRLPVRVALEIIDQLNGLKRDGFHLPIHIRYGRRAVALEPQRACMTQVKCKLAAFALVEIATTCTVTAKPIWIPESKPNNTVVAAHPGGLLDGFHRCGHGTYTMPVRPQGATGGGRSPCDDGDRRGLGLDGDVDY